MPIRRRQETTLDLSMTRFRAHVDPRVRNTVAIQIQFKETHRRFLCFDDGGKILTVTEAPIIEKLEAFGLDTFLSSELSSKAIGSILRGLFSDDWNGRYFEALISYLAREHAKAAAAAEVDTVALKVEFEVMTDILETSEKCMVCLVEFRPREVVERKACGHAYHEDCMEYCTKRNIDCPTCYYDDSESLIGAREFAYEEDSIKVSCDFPRTDDDDDDETEEESSDEAVETCMMRHMEFGPRDLVKSMPCGQLCHEDCMCYCNNSESSSGVTEFAPEEDIIKVSSDFSCTYDDETKAESSDTTKSMM